jgi:alpha-ketoglutarate-dependent taurine dioxygenase
MLVFKPLAGGGSEVTFGADAGALDLEHLTDEEFVALERAVIAHLVVVVRGQGALSPQAQLALTRRFDPMVQSYGHGNKLELMKKSVLMQDLVSIPDCPQVKLLGNGRVRDHEGIADVELRHPSHKTFHHTPLTDAQMAAGFTRFYRWHMDAALYDLNPPRVTTLLALEVPEARRETVLYDDGSGDTLEVQLGTTAFVSGAKAFELLSPEQKEWALSTQARYAPHPYIWMKNARALSTGLGLTTEGRELSRGELPPYEEAKVMTLPLVWKNPVTGKPSLQLHAYCVEDLIVRGKPIGDLAEVRRILFELMRPAIAPSRVYAHPWEPGDLVIFYNRGVWHSVVGSLRPEDKRVYHQCNLAGSDRPPAM